MLIGHSGADESRKPFLESRADSAVAIRRGRFCFSGNSGAAKPAAATTSLCTAAASLVAVKIAPFTIKAPLVVYPTKQSTLLAL